MPLMSLSWYTGCTSKILAFRISNVFTLIANYCFESFFSLLSIGCVQKGRCEAFSTLSTVADSGHLLLVTAVAGLGGSGLWYP